MRYDGRPMKLPATPSSLRQRLIASGSAWGTFCVAILLILTVSASLLGVRALKEAGDWVSKTQHNRVQIETMVGSLKETESSLRGYLLTGDLKFFRRSVMAEEATRVASQQLTSLFQDTQQAQRATALQLLIKRRLDRLGKVRGIYQAGGMPAVKAAAPKVATEDVAQLITDQAAVMLRTEENVLAQRQASSDRTAYTLRGIAGGGMILALWLVFAMGREATRQVRAHDRAMERVKQVNDRLEASIAQVEEDRRITQALARFAGLLQACQTVEEAFGVSAHSFARILPNTTGTLYLLRNSSDYAQAIADWGMPRERNDTMGPPDCWAQRQGRAFASLGSGLRCPHLQAGQAMPTTCVPLRAHGLDIGVLSIAHAVDWDRLDMAEAAGEQLALAVANLRLRETLRTQTLRDPLTGLSNRRELEEALPREISRAVRTGEPLSVLILDIDHFKAFNDTHGHDAGDALLKDFGRLLTANVRGEDLAVRLGGEEFAIILPNTNPEQAAGHAERLRQLISEMEVEHRGYSIGTITTSLGVASYPSHTLDASQLLSLADEALYRAKTSGRNLVALSSATA